MGRVEGKVAVITGAARGQGAAEARLLAAQGATVVLTDVLDAEGGATAAEIEGAAEYRHHDVTDEESWAQLVGEVLERHGRIDALVNNAGIFRLGLLANESLEEYRRVIEVNQFGTFLGMRAVAEQMARQGAGSIVNISSVAGIRGSVGITAYAASKWAVRGMTKVAALELAPFGVRVNSVHPGIVETPMLGEMTVGNPALRENLLARIPMGRIVDAGDVASMVLYLVSDESSYCTGAEFVIDGAMTT